MSKRIENRSETEPNPAADQAPIDPDMAEIERVSELVPWIGTAWRWYDYPYRLLDWSLTGWRRRLIFARGRRWLTSGCNYLIAFNEHDRNKVERRGRPFHDLVLPNDEHVQQGGIWAVEFYPPSHYDALVRGLERTGWDRNKPFVHADGSTAEQVERARTGSGFMWSQVATIVSPRTGWWPHAHVEELPPEFRHIEVHAVQLGGSLTAVIAFFSLSELGRDCLDDVWHCLHEPTLRLQGRRSPRTENRYSAGIRATQMERRRLHDLARNWLAKRLPGHFASTTSRHPVVDFTVFKNFDLLTDPPDRRMDDALRALAIDQVHFDLFVSAQLPGCALVPGRSEPRNHAVVHNCWSVVGQHERVAREVSRLDDDDEVRETARLAYELNEPIRSFLLTEACERYLLNLKHDLARARDQARARHGRFSARRVRSLRAELLTASLDLRMTVPDLRRIWQPPLRLVSHIDVRTQPAPKDSARPRTRKRRNLMKEFRQFSNELAEELLIEDEAYRQTLVTVASLGSSIESSRLGRRALALAVASLAISAVAILLADTGGNTVLAALKDWLAALA